MNNSRIFTGTGNPELARKIAEYLDVPLGEMRFRRFSDGEIHVQVDQSVRGYDVFIVQSMAPPVNEHLMELLIIIDALKRASARRITIVTPYYCYARQDKKVKPREPVTAKLVANLFETAGASRMLTIDLHAGQIVGFFDFPADHLYAGPIIADHLKKSLAIDDKWVVVSPDVGGVPRARSLAEVLGTPIAIIVKRRPEPNKCEVIEVIGDVNGKKAIMIDDLIDTGGSIINGANYLTELGCDEIYAACTHGLLSGDACARMQDSVIKKVFVTDTIPVPEEKRDSKIEVVSVAPLLGDAIYRIHNEGSVSELFSDHWMGQP